MVKGAVMENRIAELLEEQGFKPATFAKAAGVPPTTLYEILSGKRKFENVGVSSIIKIAQCFGVSVEYLSGEDTPKTRENCDSAAQADAIELVSILDRLNDQGRDELKNYANYLLSQDRFLKKEVPYYQDRHQITA